MMPTVQTHVQSALDNVSTTVAVVTTGSTAAVASLMTDLDVATRVVALIVAVLNGVWISEQLYSWWKKRRTR